MVLSRMTWRDVEAANRDAVVLIPTGSLEQHGPHLPLFTDSLLVTAVAEAVEHHIPSQERFRRAFLPIRGRYRTLWNRSYLMDSRNSS
jgi:creatinine amidohydrolase/Fe(II)-dependent formamide hydrolase-like protein